MTDRDSYRPGPAHGAEVHKDGDKWTLVLVKFLRHAPPRVWQALVDPAQIQLWAPFNANANLGVTGAKAQLATLGAPAQQTSETTVSRAEPPNRLQYNWGDGELRWELEALDGGTRLTLWHNIDRRFIAMGAAGWHICLDVLDRLIAGEPIGRIAGMDAMKFDWPRLNAEYSRQFGAETPDWRPAAS